MREEGVFSFQWGSSGVLPRENFGKIELKWCVLGYFKDVETNFLDWLKVVSCPNVFASCQAILPVAKECVAILIGLYNKNGAVSCVSWI